MKTVNFDNGISVHPLFHPKKNSKGEHFICVRFWFFQNGVRLDDKLASTGIRCDPTKWDGQRFRCSRQDFNTQEKNNRLNEIEALISDALFDLKKKNVKSVGELIKEVVHGVKPQITGKAPKGKKEEYLSKLQQHTLTAIKDSYLSGRNCSKGYEQKFTDVINYATSFFGYAPTICEITTQDCEKLKAWMERKGFKRNSISTYLNKLRTLFLHAVDKNIIAKSPIPRKGLINGYKGSKRIILSEDELLSVVALPDSSLAPTLQKAKYTFLFLSATGMGYSELKAAKKSHFEVVDGVLSIDKDREKTGESFYVPLSDFAVSLYNTYFNWMTYETGIETTFEPFEGLPSIEYMTRVFKKIAKQAGIKKNVSTYTPRHTFAANWIRNKGCIFTLKEILGHSDIRTTQIYVNLLREDMRKAAKEVYANSKFHNQ